MECRSNEPRDILPKPILQDPIAPSPQPPIAFKKPKKKIALPRRQWQINPSARVKTLANVHSRAKSKQKFEKPQNEE